jgi:signal transduction histidine kinase/CheY-like chemotaxis protein
VGAIEHRIVSATGEIKTVEEKWRVFKDAGGRPIRAVGTCQDITERKHLEQQFLRAQRMESVGVLAAGIAHDLNNVLAPILMAADLFDEPVTSDNDRAVWKLVHDSAERGASLVKQVLSFARGVHGERVAVNPATLAYDVVKVMRETFPKSISIDMTAQPDVWTFMGDATQVHQVIMNLCVNARDAMPNGGAIRVVVENTILDQTYAAMASDARPGPYVLVRVADTGVGIPEDVRDRIFEPFFTSKELGKGTGLGLSTSLAIVKSHDGFLTVESEVGVGTTFTVYFPADMSTISEEYEAARPTPARGNGELILVVDDELAIRQMVERTLVAFGYRVVLAANGAEAVSIYAEQDGRIAAVLTDMAMPIMDGPAMVVALRALDPHVTVIGSSGLDGGSIGRARTGAFAHFVPKPYTAEALLTTLAYALSQR